jgi:predicted anti-sigma-YlaC factor YlaD
MDNGFHVSGFHVSACVLTREELSARLDGEWSAGSASLDDHLTGCPNCRAWQLQLHELARTTRLRSSEQVPDLSRSISLQLAALNIESDNRRRLSPLPMLRVALAAISCGLIVAAFSNMLHAPDAIGTGHLPRELGGFEFALGLGFLLAAWRPRHATGIALVGSVVAVLLVVTALHDVLAGTTTSGIESHHLLDLVGAMVATVVARLANRGEFTTLRSGMSALGVAAAPR